VEEIRDTLSSMGAILVAMAVLALVEAAIPLKARGRWSRAHLAPNLVLTLLTFVTNALWSGLLVLGLAAAEARGFGVLHALALPSWASTLVTLLVLDLSFYVAHVAMHRVPVFWRFHRIHHADPTVDVTTTIRQHPGEGVIRYAVTAAFALPLGASPAEFLLYRSAVAFTALLEHANLRIPRRLDDLLSLVFTFPTVHKVHHSREQRFTDSNYGNLVCWWDRAFGTFTPAGEGRGVRYGLDGLDDPTTQSTAGLLALPFRRAEAAAAPQSLRRNRARASQLAVRRDPLS
jgi:sterol desaturase/sphingolipid hydroxylase (fatty acid hydroxylase superfamily)